MVTFGFDKRMEVTLKALCDVYSSGRRKFTKDKIYEGYNNYIGFDKPFEKYSDSIRMNIIDDNGVSNNISKLIITERFDVLDSKIIYQKSYL